MKQNISKYFTNTPNESDYVLWFSINKSLTNTKEDLIFGVVYIPPENSRFLINDELMTLEMEITEMCSKYKYVVLTGDLVPGHPICLNICPPTPFWLISSTFTLKPNAFSTQSPNLQIIQ